MRDTQSPVSKGETNLHKPLPQWASNQAAGMTEAHSTSYAAAPT